jgi:hypothetical protein
MKKFSAFLKTEMVPAWMDYPHCPYLLKFLERIVERLEIFLNFQDESWMHG